MLFSVRPGTVPARECVFRDEEFLFSAEPAIARAAVELFNAAVLPVYHCRVAPGEWKRAEWAMMHLDGLLEARIGNSLIRVRPDDYKIEAEFQPELVVKVLARVAARRTGG